MLQTKLSSGTNREKKIAIVIMWSLASNNQKAKLVFKSAKLDVKLENVWKCATLLPDSAESYEKIDLEFMLHVLNILRSNDKSKSAKLA